MWSLSTPNGESPASSRRPVSSTSRRSRNAGVVEAGARARSRPRACVEHRLRLESQLRGHRRDRLVDRLHVRARSAGSRSRRCAPVPVVCRSPDPPAPRAGARARTVGRAVEVRRRQAPTVRRERRTITVPARAAPTPMSARPATSPPVNGSVLCRRVAVDGRLHRAPVSDVDVGRVAAVRVVGGRRDAGRDHDVASDDDRGADESAERRGVLRRIGVLPSASGDLREVYALGVPRISRTVARRSADLPGAFTTRLDPGAIVRFAARRSGDQRGGQGTGSAASGGPVTTEPSGAYDQTS